MAVEVTGGLECWRGFEVRSVAVRDGDKQKVFVAHKTASSPDLFSGFLHAKDRIRDQNAVATRQSPASFPVCDVANQKSSFDKCGATELFSHGYGGTAWSGMRDFKLTLKSSYLHPINPTAYDVRAQLSRSHAAKDIMSGLRW